jgi:hypothetical protein
MSAWYYAVNGERSGPVEFSELERLAREGGLRAGDLVWTADFGEQWKPAWTVDGLVFGDAPPVAHEAASRPSAAFSAHEADSSGRTGLEPVQDLCRQAREALRGRYGTMIGAMLIMVVILDRPVRDGRQRAVLPASAGADARRSLTCQGRHFDGTRTSAIAWAIVACPLALGWALSAM